MVATERNARKPDGFKMVILTHPCTPKITWVRIIISLMQKSPSRKVFDEITIIPTFYVSFPLVCSLEPCTFLY